MRAQQQLDRIIKSVLAQQSSSKKDKTLGEFTKVFFGYGQQTTGLHTGASLGSSFFAV